MGKTQRLVLQAPPVLALDDAAMQVPLSVRAGRTHSHYRGAGAIPVHRGDGSVELCGVRIRLVVGDTQQQIRCCRRCVAVQVDTWNG